VVLFIVMVSISPWFWFLLPCLPPAILLWDGVGEHPPCPPAGTLAPETSLFDLLRTLVQEVAFKQEVF
jgi:hypothetical protein